MEMPIKRRAMNYRYLLMVTLVLLATAPCWSQSSSETRNFIRTFPVGRETTLDIRNKYGTIQITQWSKDSALIRAEIKAVAPGREKLGKMFDGININITGSISGISAETSFTQSLSMLFENFKGMTSKLISYDSRVEINYFISIPEYLNLNLENKYGDVYMEDITGDFTILLSNGSFKANSIGKNATLKLTFCDATINSINSGKIDASFSEIRSKEIGDVSINSISSRYEVKKAGKITLESRRDKIFIDNIGTLTGSAYFTDFTIRNLTHEATLSARYGSLNIDPVESGFESINLNTGYTDISLGFEPGTSYALDIRHLNAFLVISDKNAKTEKRILNEDKKEYMTTGTVGRNPGSSKVTIDATHGDIYLK